jgi:hypothetical protein
MLLETKKRGDSYYFLVPGSIRRMFRKELEEGKNFVVNDDIHPQKT